MWIKDFHCISFEVANMFLFIGYATHLRREHPCIQTVSYLNSSLTWDLAKYRGANEPIKQNSHMDQL